MKWNSGRLWLRVIVYSLLTLFGLFVLTQSLILWQFDEKSVRRAVTESLHDTGRKVAISGSVTPRVFPFPGLDIEGLTITEPDGRTPFAKIRQLKARFTWLPLLLGHHEVRSISMTGFNASITRQADGTLSVSDLFMRRAQDSFLVKLDNLALREGQLDYRDIITAMNGRLDAISLDAEGLNGDATLSAGAVLNSAGQPVRLAINTPLTIQDDQVSLSQLEAIAILSRPELGETKLLAQGKFKLNFATLNADGQDLSLTFTSENPASTVHLTVPRLAANLTDISLPKSELKATVNYGRSRFQAEATLNDLKFRQNNLIAERLNGELNWLVGDNRMKFTLSAPLSVVNLDQFRMEPLNLTAQAITPLLPRGKLISSMSGSLDGGIDEGRLNVRVAGKLDGSDVAMTVSQFGFIKPRHEATFNIGQLDLNRYLPENKGDRVAIFQDATPIPLDWLDLFNLDGKVHIGQLSVGRFRVSDVSADVRATPKALEVRNLGADIYDGRLQGDARLTRGDKATLDVKQTLRGMNIRPLLIDLFNFGRLEGNGNGQVNIRATGNSFADLRNTLGGDVALSLNKGALTGIDLVTALKNLPAELKEWNRPAQSDQKTTFSTLSARMALENGVGRNQDLKLASQLMNVSGGGKIDLKQNIIDYTLDVQANPSEFTRLKGVNVPLKITGPLSAPIYALDFNALVKGKKSESEKQQALKQELKKQITTILPGKY
ncbi:AsmA family protein [Paludibacterium paludis]|uniref:AsmA domain-containing protein n=1 Tax=Paludibacterium paludis TaxID=1225769 RepID=A0A918NWP0_9NEIS|nr:AsmA family protein [Paludibacterium paludis]GGY02685.1 hypothetical protein GCM10011289_01030 [Paludibacterium paludis]